MRELLAPAGNMDAFKAAIANGCNAIYLGMQKFGARAYSTNFDLDTLKEAVQYAHLRDVKVYVTMNTIVYEDEMEEMKQQIRDLNEVGVDGIIAQDLAVFQYIVDNFIDLEAHCSTQMGIDELEGTLLLKEAGAKRVVLSREVPIEAVKHIRKTADIPIEIFVHGALCVSYSGNCLMSGLTGYRSGNRGRCVGSCRKQYELIDQTNNKSITNSFIISTKDLNTIEHVDEFKGIDSLKIEGRMKESIYVANVISNYRKALDGNYQPQMHQNLAKTFSRTFTKGYLFHEDPRDISNIQRSNNFGYQIGTITGFNKGYYEITLCDELNQNDIIRIAHKDEDVILSLVKMYNRNGQLINSANKVVYVRAKERLHVGDVVYKTKDYLYTKQLETMLDGEFKRFPLDINVYAYPNQPLMIEASAFHMTYYYQGEEEVLLAKNQPTTIDQITKQFAKLNDTIFTLNSVSFDDHNVFIPVKVLNQARREIVQGLYDLKLSEKATRTKEASDKKTITFPTKQPYLTAMVSNQAQYDACKEAGITAIYYDNVVRRNQIKYQDKEGELLVGGYGGIYYYKDKNPFVTDYSLNVVNAASVYKLHELGAKRVTLSYELNRKHIQNLIENYQNENGGSPCLEMIVYGRAPLLFTKYCPLRKMNLCGKCKDRQYVLKDGNDTFPIVSHQDCTTTILNGKVLNLLDEIPSLNGIEAFRLNFTLESKEEVKEIIAIAKAKLAGDTTPTFNQQEHTRGYFNKEIV